MRSLLDENVDLRLRAFLRQLGHDATSIALDYARATRDIAVLESAVAEHCILITNDRDFGELIFVQRQPHVGVIYLRLRDTTFAVVRDRLNYVLDRYSEQLDQYLVLTERQVRIRKSEQ